MTGDADLSGEDLLEIQVFSRQAENRPGIIFRSPQDVAVISGVMLGCFLGLRLPETRDQKIGL